MLRFRYWVLVLLISIVSCSPNKEQKQEESVVESTSPTLTWAEEFDYSGTPNENIWGYREGGHGWGNNELQNYTTRSENVVVENGNLVITAVKEDYEGSEYTSAAVLTYGKQDFQYGRIEVRAKLPGGRGTWPAIWLLGNSIREGTRWPDCGEIDIMENVGFDPDTVHANVHTQSYNHILGTNKGDQIYVPDIDAYHVYAIEWYEERIDFFIDEQKYFTYRRESDDPAVWPFSKPHYLILNLAIGGNWGGQEGVDDSIFPRKFYVDYVRYYEL